MFVVISSGLSHGAGMARIMSWGYVPEDLVDLVEHLGGSQVVRGKVGVLAGGTLDAIQLFLGS